MTTESRSLAVVITPDQLLQQWQGHRSLTRRVIDAFPEDKLFTFSIGGMRPFAGLAREFLYMAAPTLRGIITGSWTPADPAAHVAEKAELLRVWDEATAEINALWAQIPAARFQETVTAWGQWDGPVYAHIWYAIENEIHHRGQGYVYLRALGIEPPPFYVR